MGPAGDSSVLATDGKRALALLKFRLAAFPVILSTPYGKISAMLSMIPLSFDSAVSLTPLSHGA